MKRNPYSLENMWEFSYRIDSLGGASYNGKVILKSTGSSFNNQNEIKWVYDHQSTDFTKNKRVDYETTGVVSTPTELWIHPPRRNGFTELQQSAFPKVEFPIKLHKEWIWGNKVKNGSYKVIGKEKRKYGDRYFAVWKIEAKSIGSYNTTYSLYYFNPQIGFTEMISENTDGKKIELLLSSSTTFP